MKKQIVIGSMMVIAALVAGCGKPEVEVEAVEEKSWAPEMVDENAGHDHTDHTGHNH